MYFLKEEADPEEAMTQDQESGVKASQLDCRRQKWSN